MSLALYSDLNNQLLSWHCNVFHIAIAEIAWIPYQSLISPQDERTYLGFQLELDRVRRCESRIGVGRVKWNEQVTTADSCGSCSLFQLVPTL